MYIEPGSNIRLLTGVNLDNTYEHSIYFDPETPSDQTNYFLSKTKKNFTSQTFQRISPGVARLQVPVNEIYDCNYMMFQNTNFGNKWFYAFITSVEYINNAVSEIRFELDELQTWYYDYELGQCYVEREHSRTDGIGTNIVPEPVALGEYTFNDYEALRFSNNYFHELAVIVAIVDVRAGAASAGRVYDGVYGAATLWAFEKTDTLGINAKIAEYIQSPDSIIDIYMVPRWLIPLETIPIYEDESQTGGAIIPEGQGGSWKVYQGDILATNTLIDGYAPRNKKLLTYPFNYFHVDNGAGSALTLRYEFFDNRRPILVARGTITNPVQVVARPSRYKNVGEYEQLTGWSELLTESLTLNGFPMCSWNADAYKAWLAQNSVPLGLNTMANLGQMGVAATFSTNPAGLIASNSIGMVSNLLSQTYTASIAADIMKGAQNNGGVNCAALLQDFHGGRVSITADMAARIDEFFDFFGYQTNKLKIPNRDARPHWCYCKTISCVLVGSIPNDSSQKIINIYNNGITWWKNGDNVGNYNLDNRVNI